MSRRQDCFRGQVDKIQLQIHLVPIKGKKYLLSIWSTHGSFCMLEYFSGITWVQDHVPCQLLIFLYIYNKRWINYIKRSLKSHSERSQWHLLLMTKGEEALASSSHNNATKTLCACLHGHCNRIESKDRKKVSNREVRRKSNGTSLKCHRVRFHIAGTKFKPRWAHSTQTACPGQLDKSQ